jgi:Tfp pilus assembly protein FimT
MWLSFNKKMSQGFSLMELLVSIGIMVAILTVVVSSQRGYTESSTLLNLADEIGITISQAQAYGIAVKELSPGTADFNAAYGLSFNILSSGANSAYLFFADRNTTDHYDGPWNCPAGGGSECVERVDFTRGNYIDSFCVVRTSGPDQCGTVNRVDITFRRPETAARIKLFNSSGQEYDPPNDKGIRIVLKSPSGLTRSVTVYNTGQISVQ